MPIIDPSDPTTLTTAALNAAEAAINLSLLGTVPAPALVAAQAAKAGLVAGIFNALRVQPIAYDAHAWDAADESVDALTAALNAALIAGMTAALNDLFAQISAIVAGVNAVVDTINSGGGIVIRIGGPSAAETALGTLAWTPLGATAPLTLTAAPAQGLVAAIAARRATLQGVRLTQQAAVAACTTVAQVIALSVSSGWGTA
jgi:hypothetical protein